MRGLILPCLVGRGVFVSSDAHAQVAGVLCPLVHEQGDSLVLTYDDALAPEYADAIDAVCTPSSPCDSAAVVVDTPLWRDETVELEAFRLDLQEIFAVTNDAQSFSAEPSFYFTNFGNDPVSARSMYEDVILEEAQAAGVSVEVALPD